MNYPPQGWQPPQQGYPQQPAQQAPQQQGVTQSADDFWATQSTGGGGAPSFNFEQLGDTVSGTIVKQEARQRTDAATRALKFNKDGSPQMQLEITLQTELRGWAKVKNVPTAPSPTPGQQGPPLPPDQDTGLRRIYVWFTMRDAVGEATAPHGGRTEAGATLAVRWVGNRPPANPGMSPSKEYKAWYKPAPAPDVAAFYGQQAPAQQQVPAAAQPAAQYVQQQWQPDPSQQQWQPPQGVPGGYAQQPAVQQVQPPGVPATAQYTDEPPF